MSPLQWFRAHRGAGRQAPANEQRPEPPPAPPSSLRDRVLELEAALQENVEYWETTGCPDCCKGDDAAECMYQLSARVLDASRRKP